MYYNTTKVKEPELTKNKKKTYTPKYKILNFFRANPTKRYTPDEVYSEIKMNCPLTSIRAMINALTEEGKLVKTEYKKKGLYEHECHTWKLKTLELF